MCDARASSDMTKPAQLRDLAPKNGCSPSSSLSTNKKQFHIQQFQYDAFGWRLHVVVSDVFQIFGWEFWQVQLIHEIVSFLQ
jgi:hypothetical protein